MSDNRSISLTTKLKNQAFETLMRDYVKFLANSGLSKNAADAKNAVGKICSAALERGDITRVQIEHIFNAIDECPFFSRTKTNDNRKNAFMLQAMSNGFLFENMNDLPDAERDLFDEIQYLGQRLMDAKYELAMQHGDAFMNEASTFYKTYERLFDAGYTTEASTLFDHPIYQVSEENYVDKTRHDVYSAVIQAIRDFKKPDFFVTGSTTIHSNGKLPLSTEDREEIVDYVSDKLDCELYMTDDIKRAQSVARFVQAISYIYESKERKKEKERNREASSEGFFANIANKISFKFSRWNTLKDKLSKMAEDINSLPDDVLNSKSSVKIVTHELLTRCIDQAAPAFDKFDKFSENFSRWLWTTLPLSRKKARQYDTVEQLRATLGDIYKLNIQLQSTNTLMYKDTTYRVFSQAGYTKSNISEAIKTTLKMINDNRERIDRFSSFIEKHNTIEVETKDEEGKVAYKKEIREGYRNIYALSQTMYATVRVLYRSLYAITSSLKSAEQKHNKQDKQK